MSAQFETRRYNILVLQKDSNRSRWIQMDRLITQWQLERQALLVSYSDLCLTQNKEGKVSDQQLQTFCQLLIDYVLSAHFRIFEKIAAAQASISSNHTELDHAALSNILQSSLAALDFNDNYENYNGHPNPTEAAQLSRDISQIGEILANRMEWEDKLVKDYQKLRRSIRDKAMPEPRLEAAAIEAPKMMLHQKRRHKEEHEHKHAHEHPYEHTHKKKSGAKVEDGQVHEHSPKSKKPRH